MGRLLFWLLLGLGAWWLLRPRSRVRPPQAPPSPRAAAEAMVDCARCGVHLPASEASHDAQRRVYCCDAHRDAGPRNDA
jgi:uncharacterized protein